MTHQSEPCNWTVDICDDCCDDSISALPSGQVELVKRWAVSFLWSATGRRYGLCEKTYRPCRRECLDWTALPSPVRIGGSWVNLSCGTCLSACGCSAISEVYLPNTQEIVSITVDGETLDPPSGVAAVYDHSRIIRTDGSLWPACQDLSVTDGPGAWSITVLQGKPLPAGAETVAGILACEFAKACLGNNGCRLPRRLSTITREGVTAAFQDNFEGLDSLLTGVFEVDAWIESNRRGGWAGPSITSPDLALDPPELTWPVMT